MVGLAVLLEGLPARVGQWDEGTSARARTRPAKPVSQIRRDVVVHCVKSIAHELL